MRKNLFTTLLLSAFISLSTVMPLNVLANETNQVSSRHQYTNEKDESSDQIRVDLSGRHLTNDKLYDELEKYDQSEIFELNISSNDLSGELNLEKLENIYYLNCAHNKITDLKLYDALCCFRINCSDNQISQFNVPSSVIISDQEIMDIGEPQFLSDYGIVNDYSAQNVYIHEKKGVNVIPFHKNFPKNDPARMKYQSEIKNSESTDQILNINSDQFSYKYEMSTDPAVNNKYLLDVTVHLDREESSSSFTNDPVNIADDAANGLVGKQDSSDTKSIHRLYNPNSGEHFYTSNTEERDYLVNVGWRSEGVGWVAPTISMAPVYRLYNPNAGDHHYTLDANERNDLQKFGWRYEGISFYSDEFQTIPLYRQYNPNAVAGAHNFTTDKYENDYLISVGWRAEKIGWYALSKQ